MYSYILCFLLLVGSYFVYGKLIERSIGIDENKQTQVWRLEDGVNHMPRSRLKGFLVQFLNILGLEPLFGVIHDTFGPSAFVLAFGVIFTKIKPREN
jgi:carbon starvation protein CstA